MGRPMPDWLQNHPLELRYARHSKTTRARVRTMLLNAHDGDEKAADLVRKVEDGKIAVYGAWSAWRGYGPSLNLTDMEPWLLNALRAEAKRTRMTEVQAAKVLIARGLAVTKRGRAVDL